MSTAAPSYHQHRYPAESIAQCVRLYDRFPLNYRGVEEVLFERGVVVSCDTIRRWCHQFGPTVATELRRSRPQPNEQWHLDEVVIKINGKTSYLWRAVNADGLVLEILVQERRTTRQPRGSCAGWSRVTRTSRGSSSRTSWPATRRP